MLVLLDHSNGGAAVGRSSSKISYDNYLDCLTPQFHFVFSALRIADLLQRVVLLYPPKRFDHEPNLDKGGADVLHVLILAVHPNDTKSVFTTTRGKSFSGFRKFMVS